jgi:pimeloyl-ACP methyl ester carboxylesterase
MGFFAALVLVVVVGIPYLLAHLITRAGTRPMDLELTSSPADFGLAFEEVTFLSADGVSLSGWLLTGGDRKAVVACGHGLFRSRREVLDRAAFFRREGYDTLVFDFRRHGKSGGDRVTLGYQERHDFQGAVEMLRQRHPEAPVVLYGVSMGAGAALLAGRETPAVAALVADSPFLDIEHAVVHHVKLLFGLPRFPVASELLWFLEKLGGFDRRDFNLEAAASELGDRPILVLAGTDDERMPPALQKRVALASKSPLSRFVSFDGAGHGAAYRVAKEAYEKEILSFLASAGL